MKSCVPKKHSNLNLKKMLNFFSPKTLSNSSKFSLLLIFHVPAKLAIFFWFGACQPYPPVVCCLRSLSPSYCSLSECSLLLSSQCVMIPHNRPNPLCLLSTHILNGSRSQTSLMVSQMGKRRDYMHLYGRFGTFRWSPHQDSNKICFLFKFQIFFFLLGYPYMWS